MLFYSLFSSSHTYTHTHTHAGQGMSNCLGLNSVVPVKVSASRAALPRNVNTPVSCPDASSSVLLTPNADPSLPTSPSSSPSCDLLWFRSNERLRCFYPPSLVSHSHSSAMYLEAQLHTRTHAQTPVVEMRAFRRWTLSDVELRM